MSQASKFREMSEEQLKFALAESQKELFRLRFQSATEKLEAPSTLKKLRRDIARIKTIQTEKFAAGSTTEEATASV